MPSQKSALLSENNEEARALLQTRVALFWKVMFFISLLSSVLGAFGAIVKPGRDFVVILAQTGQCAPPWCPRARGAPRS